jgi:hypothetical protein
MDKEKTIVPVKRVLYEYDDHTAVPSTLGYDYQFYYFVYRALKLQDDDTILKFEKKDDVSEEGEDGVTLYQLKHTVKNREHGEVVYIAPRDNDLWKTLSIWIGYVEAHNTEKEKLNYLNNTNFVLVTNKDGSKNKLLSAITQYKADKDFTPVKTILDDLYLKTSDKTKDASGKEIDNPMKKKIGKVKDNSLVDKFLEKVEVVDTFDDIIQKIRVEIARSSIRESRVDSVFKSLIGQLHSDRYLKMKVGEDVEYTRKTFRDETLACFERARADRLVFRRDYNAFNGDPLTLNFIKELVKIGDVMNTDHSKLSEYTYNWLCFNNNIHDLKANSEIADEDVDDLNADATSLWSNEHGYSKTQVDYTSEDSLNRYACGIVYRLREKNLNLATTPIGRPLSNGCFYQLSETDQIGWRADWEPKTTHHG